MQQLANSVLVPAIVSAVVGFLTAWSRYRFIERPKIREQLKSQADKERADRSREEIFRWANPILDAVDELKGRLTYILKKREYEDLAEEYYLSSTLYLFGQYFAWLRGLQEEFSYELFETQEDAYQFKEEVDKVGKALRLSLQECGIESSCEGKGRQVFQLQQRAIGELLILRGSEPKRCMSYPEFVQNWEGGDPRLKRHFAPLKALLESRTRQLSVEEAGDSAGPARKFKTVLRH